ncbi:hypothetical protein ACVW0J_001793 [Bradyrhizobium sp. i1.7.7]
MTFAAVDAALLVQHLEIGFADAAEHAVQRAGPGMRHGLADLDLGVAGARIVFLLRGPDIRRRQGGCGDGGERAGAEIAPRWILRHFLFLPSARIVLASQRGSQVGSRSSATQ